MVSACPGCGSASFLLNHRKCFVTLHCARLQTLSITGSVKRWAFQIPQTSFGCMAVGKLWQIYFASWTLSWRPKICGGSSSFLAFEQHPKLRLGRDRSSWEVCQDNSNNHCFSLIPDRKYKDLKPGTIIGQFRILISAEENTIDQWIGLVIGVCDGLMVMGLVIGPRKNCDRFEQEEEGWMQLMHFALFRISVRIRPLLQLAGPFSALLHS